MVFFRFLGISFIDPSWSSELFVLRLHVLFGMGS